MNTPLRHRIGQGAPIGLFWMSLGSGAVIELAAQAKPDAIVIDAQHGLWERATIEQAVGIAAKTAPVLVRVAGNSLSAIGEALDAGAEGVIVPMIETESEAAAAVAAARYPPEGARSAGGVRPVARDFSAYYEDAIRRTVVGVMIETQRGVDAAAAIANMPGVDFVLIGSVDLAVSLGGLPRFDARHAQACARVLQACKAAGIPCGIYTGDAAAAVARREEGYPVTVVANDIAVVVQGFSRAMAEFAQPVREKAAPQEGAPPPVAPVVPAPLVAPPLVASWDDDAAGLLAAFAASIADGRIRVVDLTRALNPATPVIALPPQQAQTEPFRISEISHYDARGQSRYWNAIACGEHTGTHFDAPAHWVSGRHYANGYTDTLPVQRLVAPAVVIDCTKEAAADENFLLEPSHIEAWEQKHGRIPDGAWVLMRTDWSKREDAARFLNIKEDGAHVPGPSAAAVRFLIQQRTINGFGVEAVDIDAGRAFSFEPPFPAHHLMHGAEKFGLASLCNLDQLPPTGALLIAPPLKIEKGSGSPVRVLALVPA
jgi:kynurenine formamidase/2-keto-3-deoxy-L-rhamnonate aldolase RhmA